MITSTTENVSQATVENEFGESITVKQAAHLLNCSISMVYRLMNRRELAYERRGRKRLPTVESIAEYRRRNLVLAEPTAALVTKSTESKQYRHLFRRRQ